MESKKSQTRRMTPYRLEAFAGHETRQHKQESHFREYAAMSLYSEKLVRRLLIVTVAKTSLDMI